MKKSERPARDYTLRVRLTAAQRAEVEHRATGASMTASDYVRAKVLAGYNGEPALVARQQKLPADLARLVVALNRVGVNLNQIARAANSSGEIDATELKQTVNEILGIVRLAAERFEEPA